MAEITSDNHGRRRAIRNLLANDPVYRRVKDALLIIMAVLGALGMSGNDIPSLMVRMRATSPSSSVDVREERGKTERFASITTQLNTQNVSIRLLEASIQNVDKKVDRLEDKIDRILLARGLGHG